MPEIRSKSLHSFSSEDPQFPAANLCEWKVTKKWKCEKPGEKQCYVVLKLDEPRVISSIDIGNEHSAFVEILVANSKQDPPVFTELVLATSLMTIIEVKSEINPNRVRFFTGDKLIESVAKQKWDLVKVVCTQPFNNKIKYGISFITLHTTEEIKYNDSPDKPAAKVAKAERVIDSDEKKRKFGKFQLRASHSGSDSDDDKKNSNDSPFSRWKSSKSSEKSKPSIKEQLTKLEENRKRIRLMPDSSDEEAPPKAKSNRNRSTGLVYLDEDDEPNDKLQKKIDKDKESREKDHKTSKSSHAKSDKSPSKSDPKKFSSFLSSDVPSTSSSSRSQSSSHNSRHSSSKNHSPKKSSRDKENDKKSPRKEKEPAKKSNSNPNVSYKPFHKLLEGVVFVFSGFVNPERGTLRQKAIDMGAKYKPDWDSSCTHLICAFSKTPKYAQVKGVGKIVKKSWIDACFSEQKRLPWRRYAFDSHDRDEPDSEGEIHNELSKPKSSEVKRKASLSGSEDDMDVVDKRKSIGNSTKHEETKAVDDEVSVVEVKAVDDEVSVVEVKAVEIDLTDKEETEENKTLNVTKEEDKTQNVMEVSTDDEANVSANNHTQATCPVFKGKSFYLNEDLSATEVIKLTSEIVSMMGKVTENSATADYVITDKQGRKIPSGIRGEVLISRWIHECHDIGGLIPTTRYKPQSLQS